MFIDQLYDTGVSSVQHSIRHTIKAYLSELVGLLLPLCWILIILLDGTEEEVYLGDDNFGKVVRSGTIRAWACASTECAMMGAVR